uniref:Serine/threonine-protein phosphatase 2A activator n=1 Tax=Plectus sambesii TaxID=2011161 RepID=A0A914UMT5_9BILA
MKLVRQLQRTYRMEPAGSHGVHSLDDYQFVPFIWGSAQLIDHPRLSPESFVNEQTVDQHKGENLFFDCVQYINETKTGPFAEHSNQLWNISAVPSWTKVNSGLFKMYEAEVLKKFPVIQHFLFGSLLPFNPLPSSHAAADVNATIASIN